MVNPYLIDLQLERIVQILLVEDNLNFAEGLQNALRSEVFVVNTVNTGNSAVHSIKVETPDMVILDIGLPDISGLQVIEKIRPEFPTLPIILLTARDTMDDKVLGLSKGADDYLTKPFDIPELVARLRVIERRISTTHSTNISIQNVSIDINANTASLDDKPLDLSRREYMLLKELMESAGKVLSKNQLETKLYHWGEEVSSNTVEVHIHNLRKKLGKDFIKNIRGIGYTIKK